MVLVVDLSDKMCSRSPSHPLANSSSSGGVRHGLNISNKNQQNEQASTGRKTKRTFDIAFLTGESDREVRNPEVAKDIKREVETNNNNTTTSANNTTNNNSTNSPNNNNNSLNNLNHISLSQKRYSSPSSLSLISYNESGEEGSPFNLTQDSNQSSDTSSSMIDVMTNGSLSESESEKSPLSTGSPTTRTNLVVDGKFTRIEKSSREDKSLPGITSIISQRGSSINTLGSGNNTHNNTGIKREKGKSSWSAYSPSSINSGSRSKDKKSCKSSRNVLGGTVKEEIRFESRRTIDINHTSDSVKIKENVQFSTLIPNPNHHQQQLHLPHHLHQNLGGGQGTLMSGSSPPSARDLNLPHQIASTFALFPHMAKFPLTMSFGNGGAGDHQRTNSNGGGGVGHGTSSSNNNNNSNSFANSNHTLNHHHQHSINPGGSFSSKLEKLEGINLSYHQQHLQLQNHNFNASAISKLRAAFPDPYAAVAASLAYPYPGLLISQDLGRLPQQQQQFSPTGIAGQGQQGQHSPQSSGGLNPSTAATLLPPSLTALTLPAQNVCAKCNIGFRMTSDLVYHMRSHHKRDTFDPLKKQREEKLKCPVCHETFRERHHLTRHMTAHQDRIDELQHASTSGMGIITSPAESVVAGVSSKLA